LSKFDSRYESIVDEKHKLDLCLNDEKHYKL